MSFRGTLKRLIGETCESPFFRPYVSRSFGKSINVVYYHYIGAPGPHYQAFFNGCTASTFAEHLARLNRVFEFASLNEILATPLAVNGRRRPQLAITFDDGLDLFQDQTLDLLDRYKIKATTFVITSCLDNQNLMWRHALSAIQSLAPEQILVKEYNALALDWKQKPIENSKSLMSATRHWDMRLKDRWASELWAHCGLPPVEEYLGEKKPYFSTNRLREWMAAGHSVGFHTHTHPYSSNLQQTDLESEILAPARMLKNSLNLSELCLSYPFGDRLRPSLEQHVYQQGLFKAFFGIRGFAPKGTPLDSLERAGAEGIRLGWPVFAAPVHKFFNRAAPSAKDSN